MTEFEKRPSELLTATDELRKLLLENPDLPLLVFAAEDCNHGAYPYESCSGCHAALGEFLDCMQEVNDERCYMDRDAFAEDLAEHLYDQYYHDWHGSNEEWDAYCDSHVKEYDPYWKKCIILYVDN